jgi:hypothetical protein
VAENDDNFVIAWIHILPRKLLISGSTAEIGGLIVDDQFRRKGIENG